MRPPLDVITRELAEMRVARAESPWSRADRARYAELARMERDALMELRERDDERPTSRLSALADRGAGSPYDATIDALRDDDKNNVEPLEPFSALRTSRPRVRPATS